MVMFPLMLDVVVLELADHVGICPEPDAGIPMDGFVFVHVKLAPNGEVI
jgi:hypothetical protein